MVRRRSDSSWNLAFTIPFALGVMACLGCLAVWVHLEHPGPHVAATPLFLALEAPALRQIAHRAQNASGASVSTPALTSTASPPEERLAYLIILSTVKYHHRREALRSSWLRWIRNDTTKFGAEVNYGFHVVLCNDKVADTNLVAAENSTHRDVFVHVSEHNTSTIVYPDKTYEFCGVEAAHRLQVIEYVLSLPVKYKFLTMIDDDGFLCVPTLVRDMHMLPQQSLLWGKFWCKQAVVRPDSNFLTISTDLMARAAKHMREWRVLPEKAESVQQPPGQRTTGGPNEQALGTPLPWGIALYRIISYYITKLGEAVHVIDDRDRVDAQQEWIMTKMQDGTWDAYNDDKFKFVGRRFHLGLCRRVVWSHRVIKKALLLRSYEAADREGQLAAITPDQLSMRPADVCRWHSEPINRTMIHIGCTKDIPVQQKTDAEWIHELCSHRFIFVRGQHHTGTGALAKLVSQGMEDVLSAFHQSAAAPDVPEYEGQFFQNLWPWDNPPALRSCYCGCASTADWVCNYQCPIRNQMGKHQSRKLLYHWRLFWNMRRPILMEKSPEMGSQHLLKLFPKVSRVVYVMRHPFSARESYISPSCSIHAITDCLDKWLLMWSKIPKASSMVVRFEDVILRAAEVHRSLWLRLGDELALPFDVSSFVSDAAEGSPRRLEHYKTSEVLDSVWSIPNDVHRKGKSIPVDIQALATKCNGDDSCARGIKYFSPVMRGMGYDLIDPRNSGLGANQQGWPFVEVHAILEHGWAETTPVSFSCDNRKQPACQNEAKMMDKYSKLCG
mmetsp:Transcript_46495/g.108341  ORF Transcript_46495/g.108341 Transcript_46495/m.108341 type:complete len:783 (+) Transcript_46495:61-2409(+)